MIAELVALDDDEKDLDKALPGAFCNNVYCSDIAKTVTGSTVTCEKCRLPGFKSGGSKATWCRKCYGPEMDQATKGGSGVMRAQTVGRVWAMLQVGLKVIPYPSLSVGVFRGNVMPATWVLPCDWCCHLTVVF